MYTNIVYYRGSIYIETKSSDVAEKPRDAPICLEMLLRINATKSCPASCHFTDYKYAHCVYKVTNEHCRFVLTADLYFTSPVDGVL